jgi:hypothetical protein
MLTCFENLGSKIGEEYGFETHTSLKKKQQLQIIFFSFLENLRNDPLPPPKKTRWVCHTMALPFT